MQGLSPAAARAPRRRARALASFVAAAAPVVGLAQGAAAPASIEAWQAFRTAQPFQSQLVAVTPPRTAPVRTLIVAEPPPGLAWPRLAAQLAPHTSGCEVREWFVMARGAVRDVVCTLKADLPGNWPEALARLQREVTGTAQGAAVTALPVPARRMIAHSLDARFGARDLHGWVGAAGGWRNNPIGPEQRLQRLLHGGVRGVYTDASRTLVLWALDRGGSLDGRAAEIRRFALASDLVLGALASPTAVLIVGRGRMESLAHLPPLRAETVALLAASTENQLQQSYERGDLLAGKGFDGVDRAPILLSPQLVDTEFGTLLNVADQLLKGWAMAGQVRYARFNYPAPRGYPFGATPALQVEKGRSNFLFNWNTDGAAYRQPMDGLDVVVPQRTGSLSVVFGDALNRPRAMEDTAYQYFATSGDTTLARVVQYTLLYQVFRQFDIRAALPPPSPRHAAFTRALDTQTRQLLQLLLAELRDDELQRALQRYWTAYVHRVPEAQLAEGHRRDAIARQVQRGMALAGALRRAHAASRGKVADALADVAGVIRRRARATAQDERLLRNARQLLAAHLPRADLALLGEQAEGLRESGLLQVAAEKTSAWTVLDPPDAPAGGASGPAAAGPVTWDRTAYVVESHGEGRGASRVGGHNLDAPLVRFSADARQAAGQIHVARDNQGQWVVNHHPGDADRVREIARHVGTRSELTRPQIEAEVNALLRRLPAAPPVALRQLRAVTGTREDFSATAPQESAWRVRALEPAEQQVLAGVGGEAIVWQAAGDGTIALTRTGSPQALQAAPLSTAAEALAVGLAQQPPPTAPGAPGPPLPVLLHGLPDLQVEATLAAVQAHLGESPHPLAPHVLVGGGTGARPAERAARLDTPIAHTGIRVHRSSARVEPLRAGRPDGYSRLEVPVTVQGQAAWQARVVVLAPVLDEATRDALVEQLAATLALQQDALSVAGLQQLLRHQLLPLWRERGVTAVLLHIDRDPGGVWRGSVIAGARWRGMRIAG